MKITQLCPTLCDPMDYTVHRILQARILEWVTVPFSRLSYKPRDRTQAYLHCRWILYQLSHQGSPRILEWVANPFSRGSSDPGIELGSPALQADSLSAERTGKPMLALIQPLFSPPIQPMYVCLSSFLLNYTLKMIAF